MKPLLPGFDCDQYNYHYNSSRRGRHRASSAGALSDADANQLAVLLPRGQSRSHHSVFRAIRGRPLWDPASTACLSAHRRPKDRNRLAVTPTFELMLQQNNTTESRFVSDILTHESCVHRSPSEGVLLIESDVFIIPKHLCRVNYESNIVITFRRSAVTCGERENGYLLNGEIPTA